MQHLNNLADALKREICPLRFLSKLIDILPHRKKIDFVHGYRQMEKIIFLDRNHWKYISPHQELNFAPNGCGLALRSIFFCCCSNNRCSLSLRFCSLNVFVGSPNSFVVSSSQPTALSSHSPSSFYTNTNSIKI